MSRLMSWHNIFIRGIENKGILPEKVIDVLNTY